MKTNLFRFFLVTLLLTTAGRRANALPEPVWTIKAEAPESSYYDPLHQILFVSNMVSGVPNEAKSIGYLQKFTSDGKLLDPGKPKWVENLRSPKGIRTYKDQLWVNTVDAILQIQIGGPDDGKVTRFPIKNEEGIPLCLNDLAIDPRDGTVYSSDFFGNRIFKIKDGVLSLFDNDPKLDSPNGLLVILESLYVVSSDLVIENGNMNFDKSPKKGTVSFYDLSEPKPKLHVSRARGFGMLDGLDVDPLGDLVTGDWNLAKVYRVNADFNPVEILDLKAKNNAANAADFSFIREKGLIVIPNTGEGKVEAFKYAELN